MSGTGGVHITEASLDLWLKAAKDCPYATYFHTPYWYDIIAPGQNHAAIHVRFDDGTCALIPVAKIKRMGGLLTDHFSSPGGNYGGWIATQTLTQSHVKQLLRVLVSKKNLTFRVNPFDPSSSYIVSDKAGQASACINKAIFTGFPRASSARFRFIDDYTYAVDLTKGEQAITQGLSDGHRRAIKSARRCGVTIRVAESWEDWDKYYGLYLNTLKRWRSGGPQMKPRNAYPQSLFRRAYENRTGNEVLRLAMKDGEPIAGALFFYWNGHVAAWHGASAAEHFNLRPNHALLWDAIEDAAAKGCKTFDFNPSGGYTGVESFKKHFGAERLYAPLVLTRTPLRSAITSCRRAIKKAPKPPKTPD